MVLIKLYLSFAKIAFTSFGGLSMIPLLTDEMTSNGWMTLEEISDIVAIAEMTPGPLGMNCATFAGMKMLGVPGAFFANLGVVTPSVVLGILAIFCYERLMHSKAMGNILLGLRPATVGMVLAVAISMSKVNYAVNGSVSAANIIIGAVGLVLLWKFKLSVPKTIGAAATLGIIFYYVIGFPMT